MIHIKNPALTFRFGYDKVSSFDDVLNYNVKRKHLQCKICKQPLDEGYSYVINSLREAGLIPMDFEPLCCTHYALKCFGLLNLKGKIEFVFADDDLFVDIKNNGIIVIRDYKKLLSGGIF